MIIRNISSRTLVLRDVGGNEYRVSAYSDLTIADTLWTDSTFRTWMRMRIRDIAVVNIQGSGTLQATTTATVPLTVKLFTGSTQDLTQWQNASATVLAKIDSAGNFSAISLNSTGALSTTNVLALNVTGDSQPRLQGQADGTLKWGPGNATTDLTLARTGTNLLQLGTTAQAARLLVLTASTSGVGHSVRVTSDANDRFLVQGDGTVKWGPGNATTDVTLRRAAAGTVAFGTSTEAATVQQFGSSASTVAFTAFVTSETNARYVQTSDGAMNWGAGGASATDTKLYRNAIAALQTDGNFRLKLVTPTYSASITPDAAAGRWQTITATNGTAFTINAPTNPPDSTHSSSLTVEILNSSGGALGVITWNAAFVLVGGAFTNPANTKKRYVRFEWNGANWIETNRASADY